MRKEWWYLTPVTISCRILIIASYVAMAEALVETTSHLGKMVKSNSSQYIKLNLSGSLQYTSKGTLTKHDRAMFNGRLEVLTDAVR